MIVVVDDDGAAVSVLLHLQCRPDRLGNHRMRWRSCIMHQTPACIPNFVNIEDVDIELFHRRSTLWCRLPNTAIETLCGIRSAMRDGCCFVLWFQLLFGMDDIWYLCSSGARLSLWRGGNKPANCSLAILSIISTYLHSYILLWDYLSHFEECYIICNPNATGCLRICTQTFRVEKIDCSGSRHRNFRKKPWQTARRKIILSSKFFEPTKVFFKI